MGSTKAASNKTTVHVAIIGDGVTGLCMSLALSRQHISHQVFPSTSPESYGPIWTLGPNAIHALNVIHPGLEERFWEQATFDLDPRWGRWCSFRSGMSRPVSTEGSTEPMPLLVDVEAHGPHAKGRGCIHQNDLSQHVCALNGGNEIWAHKVVEVGECDSGIELTMEDSSIVMADLVLACDGADGPARRWVASGEPPQPTPTLTGHRYDMMVPWQEAEFFLGSEVAGNGNVFVGRHGYVATSPVGYDDQRWLHVVAVRQIPDPGATGGKHHDLRRPEDLLRDFEGWAAPLRALLGSVKSIPAPHSITEYQVNLPHHRGRLCLLGEAAHPLTLHECSSAGMNLEDVALMSRLLPMIRRVTPEGNVETTLLVFDALRRDRTERAMETARWAGRLLQLDHPDIGDDLNVIGLNACHRWNWMWMYDVQWDVWRATHKLQQLMTVVGASEMSHLVTHQPECHLTDEEEWELHFEGLSPAMTSNISRSTTPSLGSDLGSTELGEWPEAFDDLL